MEVIFRSRAIDNRLFILTEPRKRLSGLSVAQAFSNLLISSLNTELGHPPRSQFNYDQNFHGLGFRTGVRNKFHTPRMSKLGKSHSKMKKFRCTYLL